jgi:hypothetical protein
MRCNLAIISSGDVANHTNYYAIYVADVPFAWLTCGPDPGHKAREN